MNIKPPQTGKIVAGLAASALALWLQPAQAALINKADNTSALNAGASWAGGAAPGANDTAVWTSSVLVNTNDDPLGAALSWSGIQIANPGGPITIPADGNTLTLGIGGINMYTASQGLTLSNNVAVSAPQYWQVGNGQTLYAAGGLTRSAGGAVLFSFDNNANSAAYVQTNGATGTQITANGTLFLDGTVGDGTGAGIIIGTVNDVDFAGLTANNQIVPASTISGLYTANGSGTAPTLGSLSGVYDVNNTNSYGLRVAGTAYVDAMRFNTPQLINASPNTFTYNGVGSWDVLFKASNTLDLNTLLMTTNLGSSYVVFTPAGSSVMRIADGPNEFLVYQNNPAASLVWQLPISNRTAGGIVSKLGVGTMEYQAANTYTGGTLVKAGTLQVDDAGVAGPGPITVSSGANFAALTGTVASPAPPTILSGGTNSVVVVSANGRFVNSTNLTFYAGTTWLQFVYSNSVTPSTTLAPLLVTNGTLFASNTVNISLVCSNLTAGQFPLVKYTTLVTNVASSVFPFTVGAIQSRNFAYISNNTANSSIDLVVTTVDEPLHWTAASGAWDIGLTANWQDAVGNSETYQQNPLGDNVFFNDLAAGGSPLVVTLNTNATPGLVAFNGGTLNYTVTGNGSIGGTAVLVKSGGATLVLGTTNTFTGGINLNGGILNFSTLGNLGAGAINFGGGTLQYNGNTDDISVRAVNLQAGVGTIDTAGQTITYANPIGNAGAGGLGKTGLGTLTLDGTNKYSGVTVVNQGTLALGASTYISNSAAIMVNSGAVLDAATSGVGLALNGTAAQILGGVGTVNGEISAPLGTTITPATNGVFGTLHLANDLTVSGGALAIDLAATNHDLLAVTGNLTLTSGTLQVNAIGSLTNGIYRIITYGGSLASGAGSSANLTLSGFAQGGAVATLTDTNPGEIDLIVSTGAHDGISWSGANGNTWDLASTIDWVLTGTATPWAFTNDDTVRFDDTATGGTTVELQATVLPTSVVVSNNVQSYDFEDGTSVGAGRIGGPASFVKDGPGTLLNDTASSYTGPTTIKNGVLQIGNGGIGDIGTGNITNNASLVFDQSDNNPNTGQPNPHYVTAPISGTGTLTVEGGSPLVLSGNNTFSGGTLVSGSSVVYVGNGGGTGGIGTGAVTNNGSLVVNRTGTVTLTNNLTGGGPIAFVGSATVSLGGTNTDANNLYVSNGIVKLASATAVYSDGSAGDWLILDGSAGSAAGTLDLNGHNLAVNAISGINANVNGLIENNGGTGLNTLAIVGSATTTYSGQIRDNTGTGGQIALVVENGANQTLDVENNTGNTYSGGTIISNATLTLTANDNISAPDALGSGPVTLLNGSLYAVGALNDGYTWASVPNSITVPTNYSGALYGPGRGTVAANLSGGGSFTYYTAYVRDIISGNWSGFTGQITLASSTLGGAGGQLGIDSTNGFGHVFCLNTNSEGGVNFYNQVAGTPTIPIGELADDGSTTISGTETGNNDSALAALFAVGGLNTSTNFGGTIEDNVGIIKVGTGSWTLTSANLTYSNSTTINNGVLVLGAAATLPNTTPINIVAPGILDVSAAGTLTLGAGEYSQSLEGNGTLNGSLLLNAGNTVAPGGTNDIATLTITNDVNLQGTVVMELNRTNATGINDKIVSTTVEASGTLIVTNIGPDLHTGDTFQLFSAPVTGSFAVTNLPVASSTGVTYVWTNTLAINGRIAVLAGLPNVNTTPTNLIASVSGNVLSLSWPADHTGWRLLVQTNHLANGLSANTNDWTTVAGSSSVDATNITINPALPAEFYRLVYP